MLLDDIADYLSSGGLGTVGTNLFKGFMPEAPDSAIAIYETPGFAPIVRMGNANPSTGGNVVVEQPRVQVVCRAAKRDYSTARTNAHAAFKLLASIPDRSINNVSYKWSQPVGSPGQIGRDANERVLIACNYDIVKELTP